MIGCKTIPSVTFGRIMSQEDNDEILDYCCRMTKGNLLAMEVGIEEMLNRSPRFKQWIVHLIQQFAS